MGWASLIEDVIKRFDEHEADSLPFSSRTTSPSPRAVAERARLDRETLANEIAVREYWKNERKSEEQLVLIARLKRQIETSNQELRELKNKLTEIARANEQLDKSLAKHRANFVQRLARSVTDTQRTSPTPVSALAIKIENFKEKDLAALTQESRERFMAFKAYASSERKVKAQETELITLTQSLNVANQEVVALRGFCEQIVRENRALGAEARTFEGWNAIDEWLKRNPTISPKEQDYSAISVKGKKLEEPTFNPVFKERT